MAGHLGCVDPRQPHARAVAALERVTVDDVGGGASEGRGESRHGCMPCFGAGGMSTLDANYVDSSPAAAHPLGRRIRLGRGIRS